MPRIYHRQKILQIFEDDGGPLSSSQIHACLAKEMSLATVKRELEALMKAGAIERSGEGKASRYKSRGVLVTSAVDADAADSLLSKAESLLKDLHRPIGSRMPVSYHAPLLMDYRPNESSLLPSDLSEALWKESRLSDTLPAGTYARKVLEQLLIDLSWSSSALEGNSYSLLATEALFKNIGADGVLDADALMLLNHKAAIEFMVDAVPEYGLSSATIRNIHTLLMQDMMPEGCLAGEVRRTIVNIQDSVYLPLQMPQLLEEYLSVIIEKACLIKNPIEGAFFLWLHLAYLQPFGDGNKRTSRIASNIPLLISNVAPLSFLDIDAKDYAYALMGVYEKADPSLAVILFEKAYRRSIAKYGAILRSMGPSANPFRLRYREKMSDAMQMIVRQALSPEYAAKQCDLPDADYHEFLTLLMAELPLLKIHNCSRYRLSMAEVKRWLESQD